MEVGSSTFKSSPLFLFLVFLAVVVLIYFDAIPALVHAAPAALLIAAAIVEEQDAGMILTLLEISQFECREEEAGLFQEQGGQLRDLVVSDSGEWTFLIACLDLIITAVTRQLLIEKSDDRGRNGLFLNDLGKCLFNPAANDQDLLNDGVLLVRGKLLSITYHPFPSVGLLQPAHQMTPRLDELCPDSFDILAGVHKISCKVIAYKNKCGLIYG
ncbi:hypothetical protein ASF12_13460 [Paenibacillus sp. Leaf72]|nr:hypothetical protein ASF12_13460 [Paenibacillus sp. Leaf72]